MKPNNVDKTWMTSTVWTIDTWSMYREPVRTNNEVEGWHRRINSRASRTNLQLYLLVPLLHHEAEHQVHLLSNNKLRRYQRKKYRQLQGQIFELWEKYDETNMIIFCYVRYIIMGVYVTLCTVKPEIFATVLFSLISRVLKIRENKKQ